MFSFDRRLMGSIPIEEQFAVLDGINKLSKAGIRGCFKNAAVDESKYWRHCLLPVNHSGACMHWPLCELSGKIWRCTEDMMIQHPIEKWEMEGAK